jgi:zinc transport system ATP-binding protein
MVERVGLGPQMHEPIQSLSGGQLQRVYVARALAPRPRLLLLDEPTTGIDRGNQQRLIELVSELRRELHIAVVLVSHDLRAVTSVSDRIACLNSTLHYHDVPRAFPAELARGMFCCDLEAMGLGHGAHCDHAGPAAAVSAAEWLKQGASFGAPR